MLELARWANVILATATAAAVIAIAVYRLETMTVGLRRVLPWVISLLLVIAYGSGEAAAQDAPTGLRVAMMCITLTGFLASVLWGIRDALRRHR